MPIIFENIDNHQTLAIDRELEGKYYGAKLSAALNSSNLGTNHDRGQDFGWRLQPEQQALIEEWEADYEMIDKVSAWAKVPLDRLEHADFLSYLLHTQEAGRSAERQDIAARRESEAAYQARVQALRSPQSMADVQPLKPLTLEEFLGEDSPERRAAAIAVPTADFKDTQPPTFDNPIVGGTAETPQE